MARQAAGSAICGTGDASLSDASQCNHGGCFATSIESDALLLEVRRKLAAFLNVSDPDCIVFGNNHDFAYICAKSGDCTNLERRR